MIFNWFRDHHRKELLEQPFPAEWREILEKNVAHFPLLSEEERDRLQSIARILIDEKSWEGCGGQEIDDEVKVTIAGGAALLLLNIDHDYFGNVESILVYPSDYVAPARAMGPDGVVDETPGHRLGEAWQIGPVVLSWLDVRSGAANPNDGRNVVLHEFAHKLDLGDGAVDGVPQLETEAQVERWAEVMSAEYERLVEDTEKGRASLLDSYGATNAGEFFAVATECFFEKSRQMRDRHLELYDVLRSYFKQDPAERQDRRQEQIREESEHEAETHGGHAHNASHRHHSH